MVKWLQIVKWLLDASADPRLVYLYLLTVRRYFFEGSRSYSGGVRARELQTN